VIVRPLFRSLSRPLFRALSGAVAEITKVLIDLSPTSNGFYTLSSDFAPVGDFTLECDILQDGGLGSSSSVFLGSKDGSGTYIGTLGDGQIRFRADNSTTNIPIPAPFLNLTKLIKFKAVCVSDVVTLSLSGTTIATFTETRKPVIGVIGNYNLPTTFGVWGGIISNPRLIDDVTSANSLEFEIDQLTANTETNNGVTLTYNNIGTGTSVRDTYVLSNDGTQYISDLRTIDIEAQA
jgi:hypothetical protein